MHKKIILGHILCLNLIVVNSKASVSYSCNSLFDTSGGKTLVKLLYGPAYELAEKKMFSVNPVWAELVYTHAFDAKHWGLLWGEPGQLALTDKEIVTMTSLLASGLYNQIYLHLHGFLGSGGTLKELSALIRLSWPREMQIPEDFLKHVDLELQDHGVGPVERLEFMQDMNSSEADLRQRLEIPSAFNTFTRYQLLSLTRYLARTKDSLKLKRVMHEAQLRGVQAHELDLILKHAEIYLGESAAIEGALVWDQVKGGDSNLAKQYIQKSKEYWDDSRFYRWPSLQSSKEENLLFDMALVIGTQRFGSMDYLLEDYLIKYKKHSQLDLDILTVFLRRAIENNPEAKAVVTSYFHKLSIQEPNIRSYIVSILDDANYILASKRLSNSLSLKQMDMFVGFASALGQAHKNPAALRAEFFKLKDTGYDDKSLETLLIRSLKITGYPVVMNGFLVLKNM